MIGLALVTLVSIIGASAKQSFDADHRRQRARRLPRAGQGLRQPWLHARRSPTQLRDELPGAKVVRVPSRGCSSSTATSEQLLGVSTNVEDAIDIQLQTDRPTSTPSPTAVCCVNKDTANDNGWKVGDTIEMQFEKTGVQPETVQGIYAEDQSIGSTYLLSLELVRAELRRPGRFARGGPQGVGRRRRRRPARAIERAAEAVSHRRGAGPDRVQGFADRAVQHDPEPALRDAVARGRHRAHRHREHAWRCRSTNGRASSACCARSA